MAYIRIRVCLKEVSANYRFIRHSKIEKISWDSSWCPLNREWCPLNEGFTIWPFSTLVGAVPGTRGTR